MLSSELIQLFLEQILERPASILGSTRRAANGACAVSVSEAVTRGSLAFDRRLDRVERAIVAPVFGTQAFGYRLATFVALAWIKVSALFTRMQLEIAVGAVAGDLGYVQHDSTFSTARHGSRTRHLQRSRPEGFFSRTRFGPVLALILVIAFTVHRAVLAVFLIGQKFLLSHTPCAGDWLGMRRNGDGVQ